MKPTKQQKTIVLEKECPNKYNTVSYYDTQMIVQWYLDGYTHIEVYPERKKVFIYFAVANNLLSINSDGDAYVLGMKII